MAHFQKRVIAMVTMAASRPFLSVISGGLVRLVSQPMQRAEAPKIVTRSNREEYND